MKIYEKPLIAQLMIKDDYLEDRTKKVISNLSEFLKQSVSNYKEFDSLVEILHKIVQRSFIAV
jgi:flagellar biosynthesis/type III secretory pathway ATPase